MGFIAAYKRLEKLCGEVMNDERRVSAYIDEMYRLTNGRMYVPSWDDDLKNLKHCRRLRNQIVHEPGCTEQNMCSPADEKWIDQFYCRIMEGKDPLTLYRKATKTTVKGRRDPSVRPDVYAQTGRSKAGLVGALVTGLILIALIVFLWVCFFSKLGS